MERALTAPPPLMSEEDKVRRGMHARQIIEDEMYREAWSSLEKRLMDEWEATKPADTATRESIWHALKAHKAHRKRLESFMSDGKIAADNIQKRAKDRVTGRPAAT